MMSLARSVIASASAVSPWEGGRTMVVLQCNGAAVQPSDQGAGKLLPTSEGPFYRAFSLPNWGVQWFAIFAYCLAKQSWVQIISLYSKCSVVIMSWFHCGTYDNSCSFIVLSSHLSIRFYVLSNLAEKNLCPSIVPLVLRRGECHPRPFTSLLVGQLRARREEGTFVRRP